jgi:hypothetical protein
MAMGLPPTIRPYWSNLVAEKAVAPEHRAWEWEADPFAAKKEVEARQERRKEKEFAREMNGRGGGGRSGGGSGSGDATPREEGMGVVGKGWERAPEVKMAGALREMVEATVRKVGHASFYICYVCAEC